jgi:hypothetical protein
MTTLRTSILSGGLLLVLALGSGCHHMSYTTLPGTLVSEGSLAYREVGSFELEIGEQYWLWGFAKGSDEKVARAVLEKVREMGGNGVRDLHYKVTWTVLDLCLSFCGSIITFNTQTVFVSGTVVQITGGRADHVIGLEQLEAVAAGQGALDLPVLYQ